MEPTPRLQHRSAAPEVAAVVVYLVVFGLILFIALR